MEEAFRVGLGMVGLKEADTTEEKDVEWDDDNAEDNGAYEYKDEEQHDTADVEAQELLPALFIGDYNVAKDEEALKRYQITHILAVAPLDPVFGEESFGILSPPSAPIRFIF